MAGRRDWADHFLSTTDRIFYWEILLPKFIILPHLQQLHHCSTTFVRLINKFSYRNDQIRLQRSPWFWCRTIGTKRVTPSLPIFLCNFERPVFRAQQIQNHGLYWSKLIDRICFPRSEDPKSRTHSIDRNWLIGPVFRAQKIQNHGLYWPKLINRTCFRAQKIQNHGLYWSKLINRTCFPRSEDPKSRTHSIDRNWLIGPVFRAQKIQNHGLYWPKLINRTCFRAQKIQNHGLYWSKLINRIYFPRSEDPKSRTLLIETD